MTAHPRDLTSRRLPVVAAFACVTLASGLLYSLVIPPWQAPDEPRHLEYAILLSEEGWFLTREDTSLHLQRDIMASMLESGFWTLLGHEGPDGVPASFSDDPFLKLSGSRLGDRSLLYYLVPALAFDILPEGDLLARLYLMRWFSVLLSSAAVSVACLTAFELFPNDRFMVLAVPAFLALLPMFVFIGSSANNDCLAVLCASLVTWQVARAFNRGLSWRSGLTLWSLATLGLFAKRTTFFAVPLIPVATAIYLLRRRLAPSQGQRCVVATVSILGVLVLTMLLTWRGAGAASWVPSQESQPETRTDAIARSGAYSLQVQDGVLYQILPFNTVRELRGKTVTLEAWVESAGGIQEGSLVVQVDQRRSAQLFLAGPGWERHEVTCEVSPSARLIRVTLGCPPQDERPGEGLYFDDLALFEVGREEVNRLQNGSGEIPLLRIEGRLDWFSKHLSPSQLFDPRSYDPPSLRRYLLYALLTFAGFWANFGWLTLPLDPRWYVVLALVTLLAAAGLMSWAIGLLGRLRRVGRGALTSSDTVLLVFLAGFALLVLQTFLPMIGSPWQPQGRYLFPGLVIIATLFAFGIRHLTKPLGSGLPAAIYVGGLLLFNALCLFGYIIPYYYG
jgi:hypothetical protein